MWPSQTALHQQTHYPQVALELRCWCFQPLPQVYLSHPAVCWNWWAVNSSHLGSGCTLPHPWDIPHKLVLFHYLFPILPSVLYFVMALEGSYKDQDYVPNLLGCCLASFVIILFVALCLFGMECLCLFMSQFCMFPNLCTHFDALGCCSCVGLWWPVFVYCMLGTIWKSFVYMVQNRSFIVYYLLLYYVTYTLLVTSYYADV